MIVHAEGGEYSDYACWAGGRGVSNDHTCWVEGLSIVIIHAGGGGE